MLAAALLLLGHDALPDDGMISLTYARNLAEHGCWCLTSGVGANTATSPLNVALLAAGIVVFGSPMITVGALLTGCLAALAMWLRRLGGDLAALVGPALLASTPVLTSALGLETYLAVALLVAVVRYGTGVRPRAVGVASGLAVLSRPDMAVAVAAAVVVLASARGWWPRVRTAAGTALLVAGPWFALAWWRLGSAWPDTLPVKAGQSGWGAGGTVHLLNSLPLYLQAWPVATGLTLAVLAVGALAVGLAVRDRSWPAVALGLGGTADLLAMAATAQAPAAYYVGPAVGGLGLAAVLVSTGRARHRRRRSASTPVGLSAVVVAIVTVSMLFSIGRVDQWLTGMAPLRQNWATNEQYAQIAAELPTEGVVYSSGEIGALAFFCLDHGCRVVDPYLADPGRTEQFVSRWRAEHPWAEPNYRHHEPRAPLPVRWRLDFTTAPPAGARSWPATGAGGHPWFAVLTPVP